MSTNAIKDMQEAADEFHKSIGYCIAAWARVDDEIFQIFRDCVGPAEQCAIIYYKTPGIDSRVSLTDEIVLSVLPKPARKSGGHDHPSVALWKKLRIELKNLLSVRRRIAHHPVSIMIDYPAFSASNINTHYLNAAKDDPTPESWFSIYISYYERMREKEKETKPLSLSDLKKHQENVWKLTHQLSDFYREHLTVRLESHLPPSPPADPEKKEGQNSLATMSRQQPPESSPA